MLICLMMFFSGLLSLLLVRKHFLMSLLSLEFILISIFFYIFFFFSFLDFDYFFCIMYLILGVCDGVLGLSLLVFLVRKTSNDYFDSLGLC